MAAHTAGHDAPVAKTHVANPFVPLARTGEDGEALAASISAIDDRLADIEQRLVTLEQRLQQRQDAVATPGQPLSLRKPQMPAAFEARSATMLARAVFTREQLLRGGLDEALADAIVRKQNEIELKRLDLQDRARREGYFGSERYWRELAAIDDQAVDLRKELGDEAYDRFLYNSRMTNRVKITSVMQGSAAEAAGIEPGDIVLRYNGERIFGWQELKNRISQGRRGETVTLDILRNGELFSLSLPRGPLGVRLGAARVEPE